MKTPHKQFVIKNRTFHHVISNIYLVTDADEYYLTDNNENYITDESEY
jgi:hypothetical protein